MNKPSSTITAAFLAGTGAAIVWETVGTFTGINPSPGLVSQSSVFIAGLVGYYKKENVLPVAK